ncbi:MAG: ATP-binding protein, partial [Pseudomonadota bacterium]
MKGIELGIFNRLFRRKEQADESAVEHYELGDDDEVTSYTSDTPTEVSSVAFSSQAIAHEGGNLPSGSLPRFHLSRNQAGAGSAFADQMSRVRRSFTPSQPISQPELFAGRRDLLERLIHLIEDQLLHVVVYGDRGLGKTSLLNVISSLASEADYHVVYASCGSDTTFESLSRNWLKEIPLLFHAGYEPTDEAVEKGGVFADHLSESEITVADVTALLG